nr:ABC transporter substrate-binding protein [Pleurocapsa sp. FMAR1]
MNQFPRRKFLYTAGVSAASAVLLNACLGNPPESGGETATEQAKPVDLSPEMMPETTQAVLGYIPIVEAAALVIAKEKGFFAKDTSALFSR